MGSSATVVGAGIAGLAMATGLSGLGWDVTVVERAPSPREDGAGLVLWPNGLRALDRIDAGEAVREIAEPVRGALVCDTKGRTLTALPIAAITARYGPLRAAHRVDLTRALAEVLATPPRYGSTVTVEDGNVLVDGEEVASDLIVGADGIDSIVRSKVADDIRPRDTGQFAARGIALTGADTPAGVRESWGRGVRFGLVPLRDGRTYWFAVTRSRAAAEDPRQTFAGWHEPIATVLAAPQVGVTSVLPLMDLPKLPTWHDGMSTVLIGDAAHAMTPNIGQGAAQALEDVAVLMEELRRSPVPQALAAYQGRRKRIAERVVARSRIAGTVAQAGSPLTMFLRDLAARAAPDWVSLRQAASIINATDKAS